MKIETAIKSEQVLPFIKAAELAAKHHLSVEMLHRTWDALIKQYATDERPISISNKIPNQLHLNISGLCVLKIKF